MHEVTDNPARARFELECPGGPAFISYRRDGRVLTLTHAEVPAALQGRGLGAALVKGTLDVVRHRGEQVIARCSFVVLYIGRHPEVQDLLAG